MVLELYPVQIWKVQAIKNMTWVSKLPDHGYLAINGLVLIRIIHKHACNHLS